MSMFNLTTIIAGVIMVAAFVGMIICARKQQVSPAAKPAAIGLMVVVMACAVAILYGTGIFGDTSTASFMKNEEIFTNSKGIVLGKYLSEKAAGKIALVVVDKMQNNISEERVIAALKLGMGDKIIFSAQDSPTPAPPEVAPAAEGEQPAEGEQSAPPQAAPAQPPPNSPLLDVLSYRDTMTAADFDAMIKRHPECNLIISLVGLPRDVENMEIWYTEETPEAPKPRIAVMDANVYPLKAAIQSGIILAAVTFSPNAKYDETAAPQDPQQAFDKRFLLITPETVEQITGQFPGLFQ